MANLFPLFLKLANRRCLVVGAGNVAEQKIDSLLGSGARVHVVAPNASKRIRKLAAGGCLTWTPRAFDPADLDGVVLVVAATGDRVVNQEVFREADSRRVLCNAVDEPEHCHFYYPAVLRRGELQIAISTAGHSPALAQRLRSELEGLFGPEYEPWLRWLGSVRNLFFQRQIDPQRRKQALHQIARRDVYERFMRARQRHRGGSL